RIPGNGGAGTRHALALDHGSLSEAHHPRAAREVRDGAVHDGVVESLASTLAGSGAVATGILENDVQGGRDNRSIGHEMECDAIAATAGVVADGELHDDIECAARRAGARLVQ